MKIRFDIGANDGSTSIPWLEDPEVIIYAFEPEPYIYSVMDQSVNDPRYHKINKAVSPVPGLVDFYVSTDAASSSLLPYSPEGIDNWKCPPDRYHGVKDVIKVEAITLEQFMLHENIDRVELMKIDTQGYDLGVIKSAGDRINNFDIIIMEVQVTPQELYQGSSKLDEALSYLTSKGFEKYHETPNTEGQELNLFFRNQVSNHPPMFINL